MQNTKEIIIQLKKVREEKQLSYNDILTMMELNGDYLSKSTLSRVFADGSEDQTFNYEVTIRPIANAILDIKNIEETDDPAMTAMKAMIQKNEGLIHDLEQQLTEFRLQADEDKIHSQEKMDAERAQWARSIEFLKDQIQKKDERIDFLLKSVQDKDEKHHELLDLILSCPARKQTECK